MPRLPLSVAFFLGFSLACNGGEFSGTSGGSADAKKKKARGGAVDAADGPDAGGGADSEADTGKGGKGGKGGSDADDMGGNDSSVADGIDGTDGGDLISDEGGSGSDGGSGNGGTNSGKGGTGSRNDSSGGASGKNGGTLGNTVELEGANTGNTGTTGPNGELGLENEGFTCDKGKRGVVGKVYRLQPNTKALPDFSGLTPTGQIEAININVPERSWDSGFPGVDNLVEWFAIVFFAEVDAPADGGYQFRTVSDDGSKVYIDGKRVLVNDGIHKPVRKDSAIVQLTKGKHKLKVEWFQGPRVMIALRLFWKTPGAGDFVIVPAQALTRNLDCDLSNLGTFP